MICPNCGMSIKDGSRFCEECGANLYDEYEPPQTYLRPGYSRRIDSDAVLAALKKQRRSTRIVGLKVIVLPLIG